MEVSWSQDGRKIPLPGANRLDMYGLKSKCAISQNTFNWAKDCPQRGEQVTVTEDCKTDE